MLLLQIKPVVKILGLIIFLYLQDGTYPNVSFVMKCCVMGTFLTGKGSKPVITFMREV